MDYSFAADLLSKFQGASEPIQALWLFLSALLAFTLLASITTTLHFWLKRKPPPALIGEVLYGVIRTPDGRWLAYHQGNVSVLTEEDQKRLEERKWVLH